MNRRFQPPPDHALNGRGDLLWAGVALILFFTMAALLVFVWTVPAHADHDGNDEPWRRPLLIACLPNWDYGSTRVVVHAPGYPQHGKTLHDQPWAVRDIFYRTWFRDTEDARAVDAHLIQWRREYECTHPSAALPKGGGAPAGDSPTPPPGYPPPSPTPPPTPDPTPTPGPIYPVATPSADSRVWHCHLHEGHGLGRTTFKEGDGPLRSNPCWIGHDWPNNIVAAAWHRHVTYVADHSHTSS